MPGGAFGEPTGAALSYPVTQPLATQAAEAQAAAPQNNADAAAKLAATKASTAVSEVQGQDANDKILQRLAQTPGIEKSPMGLKMLTERLKTLGMDVPKDETGGVDMTALKAMITPPLPTFSTITPEQYKAGIAMPPADRPDYPGAPKDWKTRAAEVPLTQAGINALMTPVTKAESEFGVGKGNPKALEGAALSAYKAIAARGGDTSVVDPYLNADHTALNPEFIQQKAGELVQAQVDNLHSLGIFRTDEEQYREKQLKEKVREWNNPSANQKANLSIQQMKLQQQASQFSQKIAMQAQNLQARYASISNSANSNQLRAGALGMNMFEHYLDDTSKEQNSAVTALSRVNSNINGFLNTPNADLTSPTYTNLLSQASTLHDSIYGNPAKNIPSGQAALEAARESARGGMSQIYSQITGQPAQPAGGATNVNVNLTLPGGAPGQKFGTQAGAPPQGAVTGKFNVNGKVVPGYQLNGHNFDMSGKPIQ